MTRQPPHGVLLFVGMSCCRGSRLTACSLAAAVSLRHGSRLTACSMALGFLVAWAAASRRAPGRQGGEWLQQPASLLFCFVCEGQNYVENSENRFRITIQQGHDLVYPSSVSLSHESSSWLDSQVASASGKARCSIAFKMCGGTLCLAPRSGKGKAFPPGFPFIRFNDATTALRHLHVKTMLPA